MGGRGCLGVGGRLWGCGALIPPASQREGVVLQSHRHLAGRGQGGVEILCFLALGSAKPELEVSLTLGLSELMNLVEFVAELTGSELLVPPCLSF